MRTRDKWLIALALVASAVLVGDVTALGSPRSGHDARASAVCPDRDLGSLRAGTPGASSVLVPRGAVMVELCRYSGVNDGARSLRLLERRLVRRSTLVATLAAELDALVVRTGTSACPADTGQAILAVFLYNALADDPVEISLTGCPTATNGLVRRGAEGGDLLDQLTLLAGRRDRAYEGTLVGVIRQAGGDPLAQGHKVGGPLKLMVDGHVVLRRRVAQGHGFRIVLLPGHYQLQAVASFGCPLLNVQVTPGRVDHVVVPTGCGWY